MIHDNNKFKYFVFGAIIYIILKLLNALIQ